VVKGFGNEELANKFQVLNPHKSKNGGHIVYTVVGTDSEGPFEIFRRYKEFHLLRQQLVTRLPGLYIPPVPPKKAIGNEEKTFLEDRTYYLN